MKDLSPQTYLKITAQESKNLMAFTFNDLVLGENGFEMSKKSIEAYEKYVEELEEKYK